jgi:hypothetical protein
MDRVDLIKFDIEGGELAALRGAIEKIKRCNPAIIFECGSEYWLVKEKLSRLDLYNFITVDLRYDIFSISDFLFKKGSMSYEEFHKYGLYPFRGFNFLALPRAASEQLMPTATLLARKSAPGIPRSSAGGATIMNSSTSD